MCHSFGGYCELIRCDRCCGRDVDHISAGVEAIDERVAAMTSVLPCIEEPWCMIEDVANDGCSPFVLPSQVCEALAARVERNAYNPVSSTSSTHKVPTDLVQVRQGTDA